MADDGGREGEIQMVASFSAGAGVTSIFVQAYLVMVVRDYVNVCADSLMTMAIT